MDPLISAGGHASPQQLIDWSAAETVLPGQRVGGDRHLASPNPEGFLIAVVDGLGHGEGAAVAAEVAIHTLRTYIHEPVIPLVKRCHEALKGTRGVAMSVACFSSVYDSMTWLGVGNVEGVLLRADRKTTPSHEEIKLFPGVAGYQLPSLRAVVTPVNPGDLVILFTDGIRRDFLSEPIPRQSPQRIADRICEKYGKRTDDALVLVARYTGRPR